MGGKKPSIPGEPVTPSEAPTITPILTPEGWLLPGATLPGLRPGQEPGPTTQDAPIMTREGVLFPDPGTGISFSSGETQPVKVSAAPELQELKGTIFPYILR